MPKDGKWSQEDTTAAVEAHRTKLEVSVPVGEQEAADNPFVALDDALGDSYDAMSVSFGPHSDDHTLAIGTPGRYGFVEFEPDEDE